MYICIVALYCLTIERQRGSPPRVVVLRSRELKRKEKKKEKKKPSSSLRRQERLSEVRLERRALDVRIPYYK